jgi:hypothetical protein
MAHGLAARKGLWRPDRVRRGEAAVKRALLAAGLGLLVVACGGPAPRGTARDTPTDFSGRQPAPVVQRLRAVALADERYRLVPAYEARIGDRVDSAGDYMAASFGLPVELMRVQPWRPRTPHEDLESLLADLEDDPALPADADLVIAFTASAPPASARMDDVVLSRYAGRVVVVRSLTTLFEPAGQEALHRAEVLALLRGLGTVFGALPTCGDDVMADRPAFRLADPEAARAGFGDLNLGLIRAHATLDLRTKGPRIPVDIARRAAELLAPGHGAVPACAADAIAARRALLAPLLASQAQKAAPPRDDAADGLAALEAGHADEALTQCAPVADRVPESQAARCAGLAAEKLGRSDVATRYLRAFLDHHQDDREALLALARIVGRSGDDAAARALLAGWVGRHADDADAWLNLGIAAARLGDYAGARQAWETVLRLAPDRADARDLLRRLPPAE